jgi:hypothetical protein
MTRDLYNIIAFVGACMHVSTLGTPRYTHLTHLNTLPLRGKDLWKDTSTFWAKRNTPILCTHDCSCPCRNPQRRIGNLWCSLAEFVPREWSQVFYVLCIYLAPANSTYVIALAIRVLRTNYMLAHRYVYTDMYNYMLEHKYNVCICCQASNYACLYVWSASMLVCVCVSLYCQYVSSVLASRKHTHTHTCLHTTIYVSHTGTPS